MNLVRGKFRVRGDTIEVHPAYDETAVRIELFGDEIEHITVVDPLTGEKVDDARRADRLPRHPLRGGRGAHARGDRPHRGRAAGAAGLVRGAGQAARGAAAAHAHPVRPRDDAGGRLLQRHRELLGADRRPRPPASRRTRCSTTSPTTSSWSSTRATSRCRSCTASTRATAAARRRSIEHGFRLPSAADNRPLRFDEFIERVNQVVFLSATPSAVRAPASSTRSSSRSCGPPASSTPRSSSSRPRARSTT